MVNDFKDKGYWALILGGSSGLGLATAKTLAQHGMHVCIVHRNSRSQMNRITEDFEDIKGFGVQFKSYNLDALNSNKRDRVISDLKSNFPSKEKIRVLVHSIAKGNLKPIITEADESSLQHDDFQITIDAMAISLYDWTKAVFEAKLFSDDARVLSFTSEGNSKAWKNYAAISAAKASLEAITRHLALEFAPYGIRSNCIQAGVTDTDSLRRIPDSDLLKELSKKRNPFKRLTQPEDIANAVYLLTKDEAKWINGSIIPVDGGEHIS